MKKVLLILAFYGCSRISHSTKDNILGRWKYEKAESLGDYSQNDSSSLAEFNRAKQGTEITFNRDETFITGGPEESRIFPFKQGSFTISDAGDSLALGPNENLKVYLTDSILKINTPDNAVIVWRKIIN